jgi:hypothetical protein
LKHVTLFNDGDATPDFKKQVMKTGGIYHIPGNDLGKVNETLVKAISKGNGGDVDENDIEAIVETIKKNPTLKEIILIADNNANMRDYLYIKNIKIPVRIILCGAEKSPINSQYLDLAYHTKGSIHTLEGDFTDIYKTPENGIFQNGQDSYMLKKGKFERIYLFENTSESQ